MIPNLYADDTSVNSASPKPKRALNRLEKGVGGKYIELDEVNEPSLNASKSAKYMVIGHGRQLNRAGNDLLDLVLNN